MTVLPFAGLRSAGATGIVGSIVIDRYALGDEFPALSNAKTRQ